MVITVGHGVEDGHVALLAPEGQYWPLPGDHFPHHYSKTEDITSDSVVVACGGGGGGVGKGTHYTIRPDVTKRGGGGGEEGEGGGGG